MKQLVTAARILCALLFLLSYTGIASAQVAEDDSVPTPPSVTVRREVYRLKGGLSRTISSSETADSLLTVSRQLNYVPGQIIALCQLAGLRIQQQQIPQATPLLKEAVQLAGQLHDMKDVGWAMGQVSRIQAVTSRANASATLLFIPVTEALGKAMGVSMSILSKQKDISSFFMEAPAPPDRRQPNRRSVFQGNPNPMENIPSMPTQIDGQFMNGHGRLKSDFVDRWIDTLIRFDKNSPQVVQQLTARKKIRDSSKALSNAFAKEGDYAKAYQYFLQYSAYKDSLTAEATTRRLASLAYKQNLLKKEAQIKLLTKDRQLREQEANRQRQYVFALIGCIALLGGVAFVLSRNNRAKRLANAQLSEQKEALQQTLAELKTTQAQLIQSEKMASLGELTAGIAHEIQNPLNFVNNFSEVSTELVAELIELRQQPQPDDDLENELLVDVQQNLEKINQHGKRASSIVRGMLEHARTSGGQKEPTDLNALADEYLKLSYHGLRAKDKSFNAKLTTVLEANPSQATVVPQEVGRVLLNIFNNAFYAVQKRQQRNEPGYQPEVAVYTSRTSNEITIRIWDNGIGVPEAIRQKIFQPFFTTKPTGQGTGLGLSLSYDIITKGHGGTFSLESKEGEFTELVLTLPVGAKG